MQELHLFCGDRRAGRDLSQGSGVFVAWPRHPTGRLRPETAPGIVRCGVQISLVLWVTSRVSRCIRMAMSI